MSRWRTIAVVLLVLAPLGLQAQLPDPMRPPAMVEAPRAVVPDRAPLSLESTIISRGRRIAIINGDHYAVGDTVGDGRLVRIEPTSVLLDRRGERLRLELLPSVIRKPAGG